jgi:hypothetical protein
MLHTAKADLVFSTSKDGVWSALSSGPSCVSLSSKPTDYSETGMDGKNSDEVQIQQQQQQQHNRFIEQIQVL